MRACGGFSLLPCLERHAETTSELMMHARSHEVWIHDVIDPPQTVVGCSLSWFARISVNDKHLSRLKMAVSFLKPTGIRFKTQEGMI